MIISGVVIPRPSPLMTRQNCKSSTADDVNEEVRDDPLTVKNESRPFFLTDCRYAVC